VFVVAIRVKNKGDEHGICMALLVLAARKGFQ